MTYINFITGLIIAAVLSVPGAMQHEATQVGEELVVKEHNITGEKVINPVYYGWDMTSDPSDPVYRRIDEPLDISGKCINGTNDCVLESEADHGDTITDTQAESLGLTPAPGSSSTGQYLF